MMVLAVFSRLSHCGFGIWIKPGVLQECLTAKHKLGLPRPPTIFSDPVFPILTPGSTAPAANSSCKTACLWVPRSSAQKMAGLSYGTPHVISGDALLSVAFRGPLWVSLDMYIAA